MRRVAASSARKLGACVRVEARPQGAGQLARAQRAQHLDLRTLEPAGDVADLLDHLLGAQLAAAVQARRVELDAEQDLVVVGDLRALPDQLEIGLDDRRPARRQRRIAGGVQPARELIALRRRGALDPLQPPDRRVGRRGQDGPPLRQPALLDLGVEQREGERAAGEHAVSSRPRRSDSAPSTRPWLDVTSLTSRSVWGSSSVGVRLPTCAARRELRAEPAPSAASRSEEGAADRRPLLDRAAGDRHGRERHRDGEQYDCRTTPPPPPMRSSSATPMRERAADVRPGRGAAGRAARGAPAVRSGS